MTDENTQWRAQTYALIASLLASAPNQELLRNIAEIEVNEPDSPMGKLWLQLIDAAKHSEITALEDEYQSLFIGVTHGELIPYGSYYQTGFLMEEPLAELRTDLAKLGLERQEDTAEPEDHIAAQCDAMRLILSAQGTPVISDHEFFSKHLKPWIEQFFHDLSVTKEASFYQAVGKFCLGFSKLEKMVYL